MGISGTDRNKKKNRSELIQQPRNLNHSVSVYRSPLASTQTLSKHAATDHYGSGPAAEEIEKLPFGDISWPMSGNDCIAEVDG